MSRKELDRIKSRTKILGGVQPWRPKKKDTKDY